MIVHCKNYCNEHGPGGFMFFVACIYTAHFAQQQPDWGFVLALIKAIVRLAFLLCWQQLHALNV